MKRVWSTKYKSVCENCANEFHRAGISISTRIFIFLNYNILI